MEVFNSEQELQGPQTNFIREGVKIGVVNGIIALLLMYGSYSMGLDTFVTEQFFSNFIPYMIVILIITGFRVRKKNGGYLAFREALQYSFVSYVIAALLMAVGTYILYNMVDKNLTQSSFDLSMHKIENAFRSLGMSEDQIQKELGKRDPQKTDIGTIVLGVGYGLIWDFVKSLLISLIIRKEKKPVL
jgi:hypothetical protein